MEHRNREGLLDGGETTVTITLEDDSTMECVVLAIFSADKREYIAVMPEDSANDEEGGDVFLYRYTETEAGEPELENIESDEEFEIVSDAFDEILDEHEFSELGEDWEEDPEDEDIDG